MYSDLLHIKTTRHSTTPIVPFVELPLRRSWKTTFRVNLGQDSFAFDLSSISGQGSLRSLALARSLPPELQEMILRGALCQLVYEDQVYPIHLALVCARWYWLCAPYLVRNLRLRSFRQLSQIPPERLINVESLSVTEGRESGPWFHRVVLSRSIQKMVALISMTRAADQAGDGRFYDPPIPPTFANLLPILSHRGLSHVHSLSMVNYKFKSWLAFAKTIVCLPSLINLELSAVTWTTNELESPPTWLYSHAQLTTINTNEPSTLHDLSWLLFGLRHPRNVSLQPTLILNVEDIARLAKIIGNLQALTTLSSYECIQLCELDLGQCMFFRASYPYAMFTSRLFRHSGVFHFDPRPLPYDVLRFQTRDPRQRA